MYQVGRASKHEGGASSPESRHKWWDVTRGWHQMTAMREMQCACIKSAANVWKGVITKPDRMG